MTFPTTQWSLLAEATLHGETSAAKALALFCERYRTPVITFVRSRGILPTDAEDIAHDFFLHVMEKSTLRRADATRGRFRSFLLGALVRFLGDERSRRAAAKRGGDSTLVPFDDEGAIAKLASTPVTEDTVFDHEWALGLLTRALQRIEEDYHRDGRAGAWAVLRQYVPGGVNPPSYDEGAARLQLSLGAFKSELHRLRKGLRARLREEVATTVGTPPDIDAEILYLGRVLQAGAPLAPSNKTAI